MTATRDPSDPSVGTLVHQLLDDGRAYVRAEVDVVRATAGARIRAARTAIVLAVVAIFVAQAGLTILVMAIGSMLALAVGPWAGQLIAALIALGAAGLMVRHAATRFSPAAALPAPGDTAGETGDRA